MNKVGAILGIIVSSIYLLNFTVGVFEPLPDNLPIIGNMDELAAASLLFASLKYFGIDLTGYFKRKPKDRPTRSGESSSR